jgi:hypothetical protein
LGRLVPLPLAAERHYAYQQQVTDAAVRAAEIAWAKVLLSDPLGSWRRVAPGLLALVTAAQVAAARDADPYLAAVLAEQGETDDPAGEIAPGTFAGVAADGRPLDTLLSIPAQALSDALAGGMTREQALASQGDRLRMLVETTVQDTGRSATEAGIAARPRVGGHVRMLTPPSCSRCVILAGRWYRWSSDFKRHPRCDCRMIPASEDVAKDLTTDPREYFKSLPTAAELDAEHPNLTVKMRREAGLFSQEDVFTNAGAESIRLGADINQIVNARRGALGLTPAGARITREEAKALRYGLDRGRLKAQILYGQPVYVTTEGVTRRGIAGSRLGAWEDGVKKLGQRYRSASTARIMPETILQIAENRDDAIRLLKRYGFVL